MNTTVFDQLHACSKLLLDVACQPSDELHANLRATMRAEALKGYALLWEAIQSPAPAPTPEPAPYVLPGTGIPFFRLAQDITNAHARQLTQ